MVTPNEEYPKLAEALSLAHLFLKREDKHPLGSHKGRSIPVMIDAYVAQGKKKFSISSSGNAALAAAMYVSEKNKTGAGISLEIFIGRNILENKKSSLFSFADEYIKVIEKDRPLQALFGAIQLGGQSLRQSTDDTALTGYESLAKELIAIPNLSAVFIATSSGTTAQAIGEYILKNKLPVEIHIVQTSSCHPMAAIFDPRDDLKETSDAQAISDKVAHRREKIMSVVSETKGSGWIVSNEEITKATETLSTQKVSVTQNGALSFAGMTRAVSKGKTFKGSVACIIGGK